MASRTPRVRAAGDRARRKERDRACGVLHSAGWGL